MPVLAHQRRSRAYGDGAVSGDPKVSSTVFVAVAPSFWCQATAVNRRVGPIGHLLAHKRFFLVRFVVGLWTKVTSKRCFIRRG